MHDTTTGYWLPISVWNLNELFTTESFSPYEFSQKRGFGNPSGRQQEAFENESFLTLYKIQPTADVCLRIRAEALDRAFVEENDTIIIYRKTIYFRRGNFIVFFKDERLLKLFSINTKMLLEVKTDSKYEFHNPDSRVWKYKTFQLFKGQPENELVEASRLPKDSRHSDEQVFFDKAYNQIKGLLFGLVRGLIGQASEKEANFENQLRTLKNEIAGSRTHILMNAGYEGGWSSNIILLLNIVTEGCRELLPQVSTRQLETLHLMLTSIDELFRKKADVLILQGSPNYRDKFNQVFIQLEDAKSRLYNIEVNLGISEYINELQSIKEQERKNGELKGKARQYYPKGSYEAQRKLDLKQSIKESKETPEYANQLSVISSLESEIKNFQFGTTEFDTTIDDQFSRMSDYLNDLILKSDKTFQHRKVDQVIVPDLTGCKIDIEALIEHYKQPDNPKRIFIKALPVAIEKNLSADDKGLVISALNAAFRNAFDFQGEVSNHQILRFVENLGTEFKDVESLGSEVEYLRDYYRYKINQLDEFAFPEKNVVLQNIFAYLLKPNGFEQLDKFLKERHIRMNWIAFSIWSSFLGFANLPKTFTDLIFKAENEDVFEGIDHFLFDNFINSSRS